MKDLRAYLDTFTPYLFSRVFIQPILKDRIVRVGGRTYTRPKRRGGPIEVILRIGVRAAGRKKRRFSTFFNGLLKSEQFQQDFSQEK